MTAPSNPPILPATMKAQFLDAFNTPYVLRTVPLPTLDPSSSPHDLLVRVDAASYCHTDAVVAAGQMPPNPRGFPHIGCHEFAGTIVALSPNSPSSPSPAFKIGDRVGVPGRAFHPCGVCAECARGPTPSDPHADPPGYSAYCARARSNGLDRAGGFAQYAVVDGRQVAPLPDGMGAADAATLMCAGVTIYSALVRCGVGPGGRVGIVGCGGGLGHLGLQFAAAMGLRALGVDHGDAPLALARALGTGARVVDARAEAADDVARSLGAEDGRAERAEMGLDAVVVLPESQAAFDYGVGLLRNRGRCVVVSFPRAGFRFSCDDVVFRGISIVGSLVGSNTLLRETVRLAAEHGVRAVMRTFPLAGLNELVEEYHKGLGGKLVVDMALPD
ncbi:putative alcohol dehydrogenase [Rosellinia necatrix]|uniref:Putative alcohol dehydrogenase n=1 Tax=Rosellinia necatrix TaxID=77044 RepID=A0A1W2TR56_ROSNE|nr:putative alcohol dehydrogenase [Rosellinia necatrix]